VIRVPYHFVGDPKPEEKLFVVLCHKDCYAICIKATSKVEVFENNPSKKKGCVWFPANQLPCFPLQTAIDPDNQFAIHHDVIRKAKKDGILEVYQLPDGFESDLRKAISNSATLAPRQRARILSMF
jgi:hypothetical protein